MRKNPINLSPEQVSTEILINYYRDYVQARTDVRRNTYHLRRKAALPMFDVGIETHNVFRIEQFFNAEKKRNNIELNRECVDRSINNLCDYFVQTFTDTENFPEDGSLSEYANTIGAVVNFPNVTTATRWARRFKQPLKDSITMVALLRAMKEVGYVDQIKGNARHYYVIRATKKGLDTGRRMHEVLSL